MVPAINSSHNGLTKCFYKAELLNQLNTKTGYYNKNSKSSLINLNV